MKAWKACKGSPYCTVLPALGLGGAAQLRAVGNVKLTPTILHLWYRCLFNYFTISLTGLNCAGWLFFRPRFFHLQCRLSL